METLAERIMIILKGISHFEERCQQLDAGMIVYIKHLRDCGHYTELGIKERKQHFASMVKEEKEFLSALLESVCQHLIKSVSLEQMADIEKMFKEKTADSTQQRIWQEYCKILKEATIVFAKDPKNLHWYKNLESNIEKAKFFTINPLATIGFMAVPDEYSPQINIFATIHSDSAPDTSKKVTIN